MTVALVPGVYAVPHTQLHYSSCYRSWNLHHLYLVVVVLYNKTSKFLFHFGSVKSLEMTAGYWQGISPGLGLVGDLRFLWFICSSPLTLSWPAASSFITRSTRVFYCLRTAKLHNLTLNKKKPNLQVQWSLMRTSVCLSWYSESYSLIFSPHHTVQGGKNKDIYSAEFPWSQRCRSQT